MTDPKWQVHTKGEPNSTSWEICVIHAEFAHGFLSYGWFGENKIYISSSGGPCHDTVSQEIWDDLIAVAQRQAERMNNDR